MSRQEQKVVEGAQPFLEDGEQVLGAIVARPRGWTQSTAGAAGPGAIPATLGASQEAGHVAAGTEAGLPIASPMALVLTQRRLLSFKIGSPIGLGVGGEVKELVGGAPLGDVDSIEVKSLLLGKVVTLTIRGVPIKLEVNAAADAKGLAKAFASAKASV